MTAVRAITEADVPVVRAMTEADIPAAMEVSARAFEIDLSERSARARWRERISYTLDSDPDGALIAELGGEIVGVAEAMIREGLWVLSLLTVDPTRQSAGAGRELLRAALGYGQDRADPPRSGLIVASDDPRALRLYGRAGFRLIPAFAAEGVPDRSLLGGSDDELEEIGPDRLESLAEIAREVRGAPCTAELGYALARGSTVFALADRGFTVATPGDGIWMLAARDERSATRLLRRGLAHAAGSGPVRVRWITGAQQWAITTTLELGMALSLYGALCVGGNPGTLSPFIPSAPFA